MANLNQVVRTEFASAIAQIAQERKIEPEAILNAIKHALISAYRKELGGLDDSFYYYVNLNDETGEAHIFQAGVVKKDEETGEILEWDQDVKHHKEVTPAGFGRIAAQTAKQVILQEIRRSEKEQIVGEFRDRVGEIVTGQVLRMDRGSVILEIGRGQGIMPPAQQMRGEFYRKNQRVIVVISAIDEQDQGASILVSRSVPELVTKLFEREVPEVGSGAVEIVGVAREAGVRTKIAVRSSQEGVDPVGSCVGQRGVRVQKVIEELNNEKIDIVPFHEDPVVFMKAALAPAENLLIELDQANRKAVVTAPDDQLSLEIGRGGQNARLAAKLTGYYITIKSASGEVESTVTGSEEYEIDGWQGITAQTREFLVQHKLTTIYDLDRFTDKWQNTSVLEADQKTLIENKVKEYRQEQAEKESKTDRSQKQLN
ncbi:MAG TPA: transcription termination factor NusA [Candidatus Woesebacteria bacterium]|nr:transcription termination factor NusA [Candidatus Woesebacteria bacterium]